MEGLKKTTSCMVVVFLLISAGLIPVVSASMKPIMLNKVVNNDFIEEGDHPAYYNVTRYHFKGFTFEEETIRVSYEDAIRMKQEFEYIDSLSLNSSENRNSKYDILVENGLLLNNKGDIFPNFIKNKNYNFEKNSKRSVSFLLTYINGTLGPSFINLLYFPPAAPFFITYTKGINLELMSLIMGTYSFQSDGWVNFFAMFLIGVVVLIPFFSPGGYINAFAPIGGVGEM